MDAGPPPPPLPPRPDSAELMKYIDFPCCHPVDPNCPFDCCQKYKGLFPKNTLNGVNGGFFDFIVWKEDKPFEFQRFQRQPTTQDQQHCRPQKEQARGTRRPPAANSSRYCQQSETCPKPQPQTREQELDTLSHAEPVLTKSMQGLQQQQAPSEYLSKQRPSVIMVGSNRRHELVGDNFLRSEPNPMFPPYIRGLSQKEAGAIELNAKQQPKTKRPASHSTTAKRGNVARNPKPAGAPKRKRVLAQEREIFAGRYPVTITID